MKYLHPSVFGLFVLAWTIALLIPVPKDAARMIGDDDDVFVFGKLLHVGAYGFLTLLGGSLPLSRRQCWILLVFLCVHAASTEYLQQFVYRGSSVRDAILDHVGIVFGVMVGWRWWWHRLVAPQVVTS